MIRRPPRSTRVRSSAASDVYKRQDVRPVSLGSRRRATFSLGRDGQGVVLGYRRARSHDLIDIEMCPILSPGIVARLPKLKAALAPLLGGKREARVGVTETER